MGYIAIGAIWTWWLEWYTTNHVDELKGVKWMWRERLFNIICWPIALSIFCIEFFRGIR